MNSNLNLPGITAHINFFSAAMSLENPITVLYKEVDGSKITTDVYLPPNASASPQKHPVGGSTITLQENDSTTCIT